MNITVDTILNIFTHDFYLCYYELYGAMFPVKIAENNTMNPTLLKNKVWNMLKFTLYAINRTTVELSDLPQWKRIGNQHDAILAFLSLHGKIKFVSLSWIYVLITCGHWEGGPKRGYRKFHLPSI
jgi:hypothetical protein